ncbi:MAG: hypothetical protein ABJA66_04810 [Actinomycetota bacterium]
MKEQKSLVKKTEGSANGNAMLLKIIGGAALLVGAALVIVALPDIKRYIKISTM